jgi:hypothetical protein
LDISLDLCKAHVGEWTLRGKALNESLHGGLAVEPLLAEFGNLLLLGWCLGSAPRGAGQLTTIRVDGSALFVVDWSIVDPAVAAGHVVLAVIGSGEAIARNRAVAWGVFAQGLGVAMHVVSLTFVAQKASSRRELKVSALVVPALERLKVRVNVFAGGEVSRGTRCSLTLNLLIFALELLWLVSAILSRGEWAVIVPILGREDLVQFVAPRGGVASGEGRRGGIVIRSIKNRRRGMGVVDSVTDIRSCLA